MEKQSICSTKSIPFDELYFGIVGKMGEGANHVYNRNEKKVIDTLLKEMELYQTCKELSSSQKKRFLSETKQRLAGFINSFTEDAILIWKTVDGELFDIFAGEKISLEDVYIRNQVPISFYYNWTECQIYSCMIHEKRSFSIKISDIGAFLTYREKNLFQQEEDLISTYESSDTTYKNVEYQYTKKDLY